MEEEKKNEGKVEAKKMLLHRRLSQKIGWAKKTGPSMCVAPKGWESKVRNRGVRQAYSGHSLPAA